MFESRQIYEVLWDCVSDVMRGSRWSEKSVMCWVIGVWGGEADGLYIEDTVSFLLFMVISMVMHSNIFGMSVDQLL
jgi:hypothetical protein